LGYVYLLKRDYDRAIAEGERAVSLNPNYADAHAWLAMILTSAGRPAGDGRLEPQANNSATIREHMSSLARKSYEEKQDCILV
jgi:tetratricopeptide (TPR) repeat protein